MLKYLYVKSQILKTGLLLFISSLIYSLLYNGGFFYETVNIIRKKKKKSNTYAIWHDYVVQYSSQSLFVTLFVTTFLQIYCDW